jgi:hypothetical protein
MKNSNRIISLFALSALALAACSKKSDGTSGTYPPTAAEPAAAAPPATPSSTPAATAPVQRQKAPEGAKVDFVNLKNGDTVSNPFKVSFGVQGMTVANAGTATPGTGHFHLIIDSELPPQDGPLPSNGHVMHYGKGQMETELSLPPGAHTLQIEFADGNHVPFDPPVVSAPITITVK